MLNLELPTYAEIREEQAALRAAEERRQRARLRRSYDAGRMDRLNADWSVVPTSSNRELRGSLRTLRARSRNLARNSPYVKKFLGMVRNNVSGPAGMMLQCRALLPSGEPDEQLNRKVEAAWKEWCHKEHASASGKRSWRDIQRKADTLLARDGEYLVRVVAAENKFGFALKFYSADWLDEAFNERRPDGNRVIMSVEIDANDRPVAYWLTPPPGDYQYLDGNERKRTRVPADEIIHDFLYDDENADDDSQTRGVPWLHAVMGSFQDLKGYTKAEIVAARIGASKMGFFKKLSPEEDSYDGEDEDEAQGGPLMDSAQPGTFGIIPEDYEFVKWDPEHPAGNFGPFVQAALIEMAAGIDLSYFSLTGDLSAVNYSSARVGQLAERDIWRGLQNFKIEHFNRRVFLLWLRAALLSGALDIRVSDYKRLLEPVWRARGWAWTDPKKEADAAVVGIDNGFDTLTETLAEQGRDIEQVIETRKRELKMLQNAGIEIAPQASQKAAGDNTDGETESAES